MKKNFQQLQDIRNSLEATIFYPISYYFYTTFISLQGYLPLLDSVLEIDAENHDAPIDLEGKFEVLGSAWTVYLQLEAVLHLAQKPEEHNEIMDWTVQHLNWAKDKVLPMVDQSELADHVLSSLMMFTSNLVTLNLCQERFAQESVEIILDMLEGN